MNHKFIPNANRLAALLHPAEQNMVVTAVRQVSSTMKTYTLRSAEGKELAYFEAGSYIPVHLDIDGNWIERPYSLSSSPKQAEEGLYEISVKEIDGGYVSHYIHDNWIEGTRVRLGAPYPGECYNPVRDSKQVIALAGGSGITGFYSLAQAMCDGDVAIEKLIVFYGVNTEAELMDSNAWNVLEEKSGGAIRCIRVVADDQSGKYETGYITLDMIRKYCNIEDASFFISGPEAMIRTMKGFLEPLGIKHRRIRISMSGDSGYNAGAVSDEKVTLTVHMAGETYTVPAKKSETVLAALDRAALNPAARCRSGKCGFCRAMVIRGKYTLAEEETGVRKMDKQLGFIHPCCSRPTTDMELVVQRG